MSIVLVGVLINVLIIRIIAVGNEVEITLCNEYFLFILCVLPFTVRIALFRVSISTVIAGVGMIILTSICNLSAFYKAHHIVMAILGIFWCNFVYYYRISYFKDLYKVHAKLYDLRQRNAILSELSVEAATEKTGVTGLTGGTALTGATEVSEYTTQHTMSTVLKTRIVKNLQSAVNYLTDDIGNQGPCASRINHALSVINTCLDQLGHDYCEVPSLEMTLDKHQEVWVNGDLKYGSISIQKPRKMTGGSNFSLNIGLPKRRLSFGSTAINRSSLDGNFDNVVVPALTGMSVKSNRSHSISKKSNYNSQPFIKSGLYSQSIPASSLPSSKESNEILSGRKIYLKPIEKVNFDLEKQRPSERRTSKTFERLKEVQNESFVTPACRSSDADVSETSNMSSDVSLASCISMIDDWSFDIFDFSSKVRRKPLLSLAQIIFQRLNIYDAFGR